MGIDVLVKKGMSFQTKNNAEVIGNIEKSLNIKFMDSELFKGNDNNHKFKEGDILELHGLEDYPQFNGELVEISSIREDGHYGKAYYFKTSNAELAENLNWIYEHRLRVKK